jgi:nitrite reductase (NO-forming)
MRYAAAGESYPDTLALMNGLIPSRVVFNVGAGSLKGTMP